MGKTGAFINRYRKGVGKKYLYIDFTILFFILILFIYSWYYLSGTTLIWCADGKDQHFKALVYYARYLRSIIKNLLYERSLRIPQWDFAIGEGSDIFSVMNLYAIGDPFNFFSFLIPTRFLSYYHDAATILRIYVAGLAFITMCISFGKKDRWAVLSGVLTYVFCYYVIYNSTSHSYFILPMIYLPILIMGIESVIRKKTPFILLWTVALSAISSFYLFYMLVLEVIIYTIVRVICIYGKDIKKSIKTITVIAIYSFLGFLCSSVLSFPSIYFMMQSDRTGYEYPNQLFYGITYYFKLPGILASRYVIESLQMGFTVPAILAVFLLLKNRKNKELVILSVLSIIALFLPIFGRLFNGMGYAANRWVFAISLLVAYNLTANWNDLVYIDKGNTLFLVKCVAVWTFLCMIFDESRVADAFVSIIISLLYIVLVLFAGREGDGKNRKQITFGGVVISIICLAVWNNAEFGLKFVDYCLNKKEALESTFLNESYAIKNLAEAENVTDFYRYSGRNNLTVNGGVLNGISSTQYYWSIANPYINDFRTEMSVLENSPFCFYGYDERAPLMALSSVKYYVANDSFVPYSYRYLGHYDIWENEKEQYYNRLSQITKSEDLTDFQKTMINISLGANKSYDIYENPNALSLSYSYNGRIAEKDWDKLSAVEKQSAMLQAVYLSEEKDIEKTQIDETEIITDVKHIDFDIITDNDEVVCRDGKFIVTGKNVSAELELSEVPQGELYVQIKGLRTESTSDFDLYFGDDTVDPENAYNKVTWELLPLSQKKEIINKKLRWKQPGEMKLMISHPGGNVNKELLLYTKEYNYYYGRNNFAINMGQCSTDEPDIIKITFPRPGIYYYDDISVESYGYNNFEKQIEELKENRMYNEAVDFDKVSGEIDVDKPEILCLAIPYAEGWTAYVDGQEQRLMQANIKYMALELGKGHHSIELRYKTPWYKEGVLISIAVTVFSVIYNLLEVKRRKRNDKL